jgi:hypothetical protein
MKRLFCLLGMAAGLSMAPIVASASDTATQHVWTPVESGPDAGSCGNLWAVDTARAHFAIRPGDSSGTYRVDMRIIGTFATTGPVSPGACDSDTHHGSTLRPGIAGSFWNNYHFEVVGTLNPALVCTGIGACLNELFGQDAEINLISATGHYAAGGSDLIYHEWWQSTTSHTDQGDIATG